MVATARRQQTARAWPALQVDYVHLALTSTRHSVTAPAQLTTVAHHAHQWGAAIQGSITFPAMGLGRLIHALPAQVSSKRKCDAHLKRTLQAHSMAD